MAQNFASFTLLDDNASWNIDIFFEKIMVFDFSVALRLCFRFPKTLGESGNEMIIVHPCSSKVVFIKGFFNESLPDLHDRLRADGSGLAWLQWFGVAKTLRRFTSPKH